MMIPTEDEMAVGRQRRFRVTAISKRSYFRNRCVQRTVIYLGSAGEYCFYLGWRGLTTSRSMVGREHSRKLLGLFH